MYVTAGLGTQFNAAFLKLFTLLEDVRETQRVQGSMLQSIMRHLEPQQPDAVLPEGVTLPLTSMSAFDELEANLSDPACQSAIVSSLNLKCLNLHFQTESWAASLQPAGRAGGAAQPYVL